MNKSIKIKIPLYSGVWEIIFCDKLKVIEDKYELTSTKGCDAIMVSIKNKLITGFEIKHVNAGIVAHECTHLINRIFDDHCVELDLVNDEHQAYMMKWAVNNVHKFYKKVTNKRIR